MEPTTPAGFNFTGQMFDLCRDACRRLPELRHIRMDEVAVSFCQTRRRVLHGLQAKLTPMRFAGGSLYTQRRGRKYTVERLYGPDGGEFLYILSFYLPRFLDQTVDEKLTTIFHELWHISPDFDGDLRRFPGRCYAHSHSQKEFDDHARDLSRAWIASGAPARLHAFLDYTFDELHRRHGGIYGLKLRIPKLLPMPHQPTR